MKKFILPFIITLAFYSESLFVDFFPEKIFGFTYTFVPRFLIILIVLMAIYYHKNVTYIYAALFGLLFDIYYTEVIGIYLCLFPVIVYVSLKLAKILHINVLTVILIAIFCVALLEFSVYGSNILIRQTTLPLEEFIGTRLYATLILNFIFVAILYYPFSRFLLRRKKDMIKE